MLRRLNEDIILKTRGEMVRIEQSCRLVSKILTALRGMAVPGVLDTDLEKEAGRLLAVHGAESGLEVIENFGRPVSISINEVAAHGRADGHCLQNGDLVTLDLALKKGGWYGDGAVSFSVGTGSAYTRKLIDAVQAVYVAGLEKAKPGNRLGDVGAAMEREADARGVRIVRELVGHGIGQALHEDPKVPPFGIEDTGTPMVPGLVITLEPVITPGNGRVELASDGWSYITADRSPAVQLEHTIAVTSQGPLVLTSHKT
jgi:methionyl aminopeptidase